MLVEERKINLLFFIKNFSETEEIERESGVFLDTSSCMKGSTWTVNEEIDNKIIDPLIMAKCRR